MKGAITTRADLEALMERAQASYEQIPIWDVWKFGLDAPGMDKSFLTATSAFETQKEGLRLSVTPADDKDTFTQLNLYLLEGFGPHPIGYLFTNFWHAWACKCKLEAMKV